MKYRAYYVFKWDLNQTKLQHKTHTKIIKKLNIQTIRNLMKLKLGLGIVYANCPVNVTGPFYSSRASMGQRYREHYTAIMTLTSKKCRTTGC